MGNDNYSTLPLKQEAINVFFKEPKDIVDWLTDSCSPGMSYYDMCFLAACHIAKHGSHPYSRQVNPFSVSIWLKDNKEEILPYLEEQIQLEE